MIYRKMERATINSVKFFLLINFCFFSYFYLKMVPCFLCRRIICVRSAHHHSSWTILKLGRMLQFCSFIRLCSLARSLTYIYGLAWLATATDTTIQNLIFPSLLSLRRNGYFRLHCLMFISNFHCDSAISSRLVQYTCIKTVLCRYHWHTHRDRECEWLTRNVDSFSSRFCAPRTFCLQC